MKTLSKTVYSIKRKIGMPRLLSTTYFLLAFSVAFIGLFLMVQSAECAMEVLTSDQTKQRIENVVYELSGKSRDDLIIEFRYVPQSIKVPDGSRVEITLPRMLERRGSAVAYITVKSDDGRYTRRIPVSLKLRTFDYVFVAKKRLGRGHILVPDDIRRERVETTNLSGGLVKESSEIYGKKTKRIVNTGASIRTDMIDLPNLIERGDIVNIVAHLEGVKATGVGKAKQSGRKGDMIMIKNVDSGRQITGRIKDSSTVLVNQ